jgi:hypothetical protein
VRRIIIRGRFLNYQVERRVVLFRHCNTRIWIYPWVLRVCFYAGRLFALTWIRPSRRACLMTLLAGHFIPVCSLIVTPQTTASLP